MNKFWKQKEADYDEWCEEICFLKGQEPIFIPLDFYNLYLSVCLVSPSTPSPLSLSLSLLFFGAQLIHKKPISIKTAY